MAGLKKTIIRTGLETLYFTGLHHWLRPFVGGVGAILTLHQVRPPRPDAFQPNRLLEVSPRFLERLLRRLSRARIDVVSLDEMHRRLITSEFKRRFVCITFDDGYKDMGRYAYPLLQKYKTPFALYIPTSFPDRVGELWWVALEAVTAVLGTGGKSNLFPALSGKFSIDVVPNPRLTWTTKFAVFRDDEAAKPFILQEEDGGREVIALGEGSEYEQINRKCLFGIDWSGNVAFGYWQYAVLVTFT